MLRLHWKILWNSEYWIYLCLQIRLILMEYIFFFVYLQFCAFVLFYKNFRIWKVTLTLTVVRLPFWILKDRQLINIVIRKQVRKCIGSLPPNSFSQNLFLNTSLNAAKILKQKIFRQIAIKVAFKRMDFSKNPV